MPWRWMVCILKSDYAKLQGSLDKSLNNASQNNVSIEKLVDQIKVLMEQTRIPPQLW